MKSTFELQGILRHSGRTSVWYYGDRLPSAHPSSSRLIHRALIFYVKANRYFSNVAGSISTTPETCEQTGVVIFCFQNLFMRFSIFGMWWPCHCDRLCFSLNWCYVIFAWYVHPTWIVSTWESSSIRWA